jgi:CheY-like chemotaxis protein
LRVLLVDNDPDFCAVLRVLLPSAVEVVGEAHDGFRAVELARETTPDAILMDFHMPLMDGVATTLSIRTFLPDVRVVVLSGTDESHPYADLLRLERLRKAELDEHVLARLFGRDTSRGSGCRPGTVVP